jgi:hypothetical protein
MEAFAPKLSISARVVSLAQLSCNSRTRGAGIDTEIEVLPAITSMEERVQDVAPNDAARMNGGGGGTRTRNLPSFSRSNS